MGRKMGREMGRERKRKRAKRKQLQRKLGTAILGSAFFIGAIALVSLAARFDQECDPTHYPYIIDGEILAESSGNVWIEDLDGNVWEWEDESGELRCGKFVTLKMSPNGTMDIEDDVILEITVQED